MVSPEFAFLLQVCIAWRCGSGKLPYSPNGDLRTLNSEELYRLARIHKVSGVLEAYLEAVHEKLAEPAASRLHAVSRREAAMRLIFLEEWQKLCEAFAKHHIAVLTIKGPAASIQLYGSPCIREFTDLDIVAAEPDSTRVDSVMESVGYWPVEAAGFPEGSKRPSRRWYVAETHHTVFKSPRSPFRVEVHFRFIDGGEHDLLQNHQLFSRSTAVVCGDFLAEVPSLSDHALLLIVHGVRHAWSQLHWILDALKIFTLPDPEFHRSLADIGQQTGYAKHIVLTAGLLDHLVPGFTLPEPYRAMYARWSRVNTRHLKRIERKLNSEVRPAGSLIEILGMVWGYRMALELSWGSKLRTFLTPFLVSPTDLLTFPLPEALEPLHLLLRPFFVARRRLARRFARQADSRKVKSGNCP